MYENFGMIIPQRPVVEHKPKPIPKWKKVVCFLIGHKWGSTGASWIGPGFPKKCIRCRVSKWFHKPTIRMRLTKLIDRTLDKLWIPLCKAGIHRYKFHYAFYSFCCSWDKPYEEIKQHIYKCSCCKKIKTVNL